MTAESNTNGNSLTRASIANWDQLPEQIIAPQLRPWAESGFTPWRHILRGAILGGIAGCTSLMMNIIGSISWTTGSGANQHPLHIVQVYLTFPLGEPALRLDGGLTLALGCVLYMVTGMLYGVLFEFLVSFFLPRAGWTARLVAFSLLGLALWAFNFYVLLSWLQPALFGGQWILELIPWWVAAATHLVFGLTMALIYTPDTDRAQHIGREPFRT